MNTGYTIRLFLLALLLGSTAGCSAIHKRRLAESNYEQAVIANNMGHTDEAINSLKLATTQNPKLTPAHELLGDLYRERGDYERACLEYETCTKLDPDASHFYQLGLMNHLLGHLQFAADSYLRALEFKPADADTNMNLGLVYLNLGDHAKAIEHLRAATKKNPDSIETWTNLGVALDDSGDLAGAEQAYRKALERHGDQNALWVNYAGNLIQQRRPDEAIKFLQTAIDQRDSPLAEKRMGDALTVKGWPDAAIGRYELAIKLDPRYINAYNALGDTLIAQYDRGLQLNESLHSRAITAWKTSLLLRPNQSIVVDRLKKWSRDS